MAERTSLRTARVLLRWSRQGGVGASRVLIARRSGSPRRSIGEQVAEKDSEHLKKVRAELTRYEHPLFGWDASASARGVEVTVRLKHQGIHDEPYRFCLIAREIDAAAFQWDFQRQLYNYLHDYLVEMFTRSPQIKEY